MGLGSVAVNQLVKWEVKLNEDLDKMLEKAKAANEARYFGNVFVCFWVVLLFNLVLYCERLDFCGY